MRNVMQMRRKAIALSHSIEKNKWEMAKILVLIRDHELWPSWGFSSWMDYVERELQISIRMAQHMMRTWRWHLSMPREAQQWMRRKPINIVRMIVSVADEKNWKDWARRIEGLSQREVEGLVFGRIEDNKEAASIIVVRRAMAETRGLPLMMRAAMMRSLGVSAEQVADLLGLCVDDVQSELRLLNVFVPREVYEEAAERGGKAGRRVVHEVGLAIQQQYSVKRARARKAG